MKTILTKVNNIYTLMKGDKMFASSDLDFQIDYEVKKLSKENCDEIFGVTDVNDIRKSVNTSVYLGGTTSNTLMSIATEQSLQQPTEIEVEVCCYIGNGDKESDSFKDPLVTNTGIPKLDENDCLILKKK
jgi:hypothetical protein